MAQSLEQGELGLEQAQDTMEKFASNDEIGILSRSFDPSICPFAPYVGA